MSLKLILTHYGRAIKSLFGWKKYSDKCSTCTHSVDKRITNANNLCVFDNITWHKYHCEYENTIDLEGQYTMPMGCSIAPQNVPQMSVPPSK